MTQDFDGVEYIEGDREPITNFLVGDRIGGQGFLVTKSEAHPTDPDQWCLSWVVQSAIVDEQLSEYEGPRTVQDKRWKQATYLIQETP